GEPGQPPLLERNLVVRAVTDDMPRGDDGSADPISGQGLVDLFDEAGGFRLRSDDHGPAAEVAGDHGRIHAGMPGVGGGSEHHGRQGARRAGEPVS
ncbi:MAG: hypothetical protein ACYSWU_06805, partial [Planctomycetota bacterium]